MRTVHVVLLTAVALLCGLPAAAQERQVPLDHAGRVQVVEAGLAQRLGLWTEQYPDFREARLFETAEGGYVLEITTARAGEVRRQRVPMTAEEVALLRARIARTMAEGRIVMREDGDARYLLLGQTTLAGLTAYGPAVPVILGADGPGGAGLYLLTAAGSFFLPFALTAGEPVSFGMAHLSRYGVTRGYAHGMLLHYALAGDHDRVSDSDERGRLALGMGVSVAEAIGGYWWARNEDMSAGTANTIVTFGDAGMLWGFAVPYALAGVEGRAAAATTLAGGAAGVLVGNAFAARRDFTWGDADMLYTAGAVGALSGLAVAAVGDMDDRGGAGLAAVGSAVGLLLADRVLHDKDFTVGHGVLTRLGALAGGLAGASIGVMAEDENLALIGGAAGAIGGYALTFGALAPDARARRGERMSGVEIKLHPQGLAKLARSGDAAADVPSPLFDVRYRLGRSAPAGAR